MKLLATILFCAALAAGQAAPPAVSDHENARKARALIDQMIQALGGPAYMGIQDISQEGRTYSFYHGQPNSAGLVFWRFYRFPDKDRIEVTKKRDWIVIHNGNRSYEITFKGTAAGDPVELKDYLRRSQYALDWILRHWLDQPGTALFYEGSTVASEKQAEQVTLMNAQNQGVTLFIDASTHLPIKKSYSWRDPSDKLRSTEEEVYDNYRPVQGIMTPFSVTRFLNGEMSAQRFMTSVSYNRNLSDSLFTPPNADQVKPLPVK